MGGGGSVDSELIVVVDKLTHPSRNAGGRGRGCQDDEDASMALTLLL